MSEQQIDYDKLAAAILKIQTAAKEQRPERVDLKYLCPKDPNRAALLKKAGDSTTVYVLPHEGPRHLGGQFIDVKLKTERKKDPADPRGRATYEIGWYEATRLCDGDAESRTPCDAEMHIEHYFGPFRIFGESVAMPV